VHTFGRWARGGRALALAAAVAAPAAAALAEAPAWLPAKPGRYATDATGRLDAARVSALNEKLATFERQTSNQVLVYVAGRVPPGTTLEEFANKAFSAWGIGQKGKDNGVLFAVFLDDRVMRIEVGYGLEGVLPDARARDITSDVVKPHFKSGDFTGGIEAGTEAIFAAVRGEGNAGTGQTLFEARVQAVPWGGVAIALSVCFGIGALGAWRTYATTHRYQTKKHDWIFTGVGLASFFSAVALAMTAMVVQQGFVLRLAMLAGAVFASSRIVETMKGTWTGSSDTPAAARFLRRAALVAAAAAPLAVPLAPWPPNTRLLWMVAAAGSAVLLLVLLANAIEDTGFTRVRSVIAPLLWMGGLFMLPFVWEVMKYGQVPVNQLYTMGGLIVAGAVVWPGLISWSAGGGGGWSGGGGGGSSSSSSSSDSGSSYSGGGGDSGGGGSSDSW
jgi:uncharacterized protein